MVGIIAAVDTQASSVAGIIAAVGTLITAIGAVVLGWRQQQMNREVKNVHKIVNQQRTDMQRYQAALVQVLHAHNIEVPIDQSLPIAEVGAVPPVPEEMKWIVKPAPPEGSPDDT